MLLVFCPSPSRRAWFPHLGVLVEVVAHGEEVLGVRGGVGEPVGAVRRGKVHLGLAAGTSR